MKKKYYDCLLDRSRLSLLELENTLLKLEKSHLQDDYNYLKDKYKNSEVNLNDVI